MMTSGSNDMNKNSYNIASSETAQQQFHATAAKLEAALAAHEKQVNTLMAQYQADGVSEEHHGNEQQWHTNAQEVRNIINAVKSSLEKSDGHAQTALSTAAKATAI